MEEKNASSASPAVAATSSVAVKKKKKEEENIGAAKGVYFVQRVLVIIGTAMIFFPFANPTRICELVSRKIGLFTAAVSWGTLTESCSRPFRMGWVDKSTFIVVYLGAIIALLGIASVAAGGCLSLGNLRCKKLGLKFSLFGALGQLLGYVLCFAAYIMIQNARNLDKVNPIFPTGVFVYGGVAAVILILTIVIMIMLPKVEKGTPYEMESKFKLFLMFLPFAFLCFLFCYLPLYGWRYAFFDYKSGSTLSMDTFVGFKWFTYLFQNSATRNDVINVMKNTLGISGINICTSWLPMIFAVFLCEMRNVRFRRVVQALTTIPNFISWVLVYAVALAIFSTDGFINTLGQATGLIAESVTPKNYLMGDSHTWIKMWAWGTWKGIGWSAIIYIASIAGIDQSLYEAATVDGAGRFQRMWHITLPGLSSTFFVLLLMAIAGILSNGLDQYLVFENAENVQHIRVLDLYVYRLGIGNGSIPLSTVVGMFKSVISVILLFAANGVSKALRGESIV